MKHCVSATAWPNVGNVSLNFTRGNLWVNRAQIKGFTVQTGVTNLLLVGDVLRFDYAPASLHWELRIHPKFFPPSSNTYNFDYVFDLANSWSYVGTTPTPTTINFGLMFISGEGLPRLGTEPSLMGDTNQRADLAPLTGYWLPAVSPP